MITPASQSVSHAINHIQSAAIKRNVASTFDQQLIPNGPDYKEVTALREGLRQAETPDQLRETIDAFLLEPETSATEEFAKLMETKRKGAHPLHDRIDRLNKAVSELRGAMGTYSDQEMIVETNEIIRELQLEIEMLQNKIEQEIENSFLQKAEE